MAYFIFHSVAWIFGGLGALTFAVLATESNRILIFKEPIPDKALPGHVIRTESVADEGSCRVKCYMEPNCASINVGLTVQGRHTCELNSVTGNENQSQSALEERQGYIHYSVENFCNGDPCRGMNALCQVGFSNSGYRCVCQKGYTPECQEPLGMENGGILNAQIRASSEWSVNYAAIQGRLNFQASGPKIGAWSAGTNTANEWLQIDLRSKHTRVTGVATQGRNSYCCQWIAQYKLQYGVDGANFQYYKQQGQNVEKEFDGNIDQNSIVHHRLNPPITARYIRFRPTAWHGHISMRVELYGCQDCVPGGGLLSGSHYVLFTKRETWQKARANCEKFGADLVKIESAVENEFLNTAFLTSGLSRVTYWIGLSDQVNEGEWKWTDGSLLGGIYSNWGNRNPNNQGGNQNCAGIVRGMIGDGHFYDAEWNDWNCAYAQGYICEKDQI